MQLHQYALDQRPELLPLLAQAGPAMRVLDIGCGPGGFGISLRGRYPDAHLSAVEPEASSAAVARQHFDVVHEGFFPHALPESSERFDLIVMNDVIEHVADPWSIMEQVRGHLTETGMVLAAIPNVGHLPTSANLLFRGRWEYVESGTLDRTHLRFFTRSTVEQLFQSSGFELIQLNPLNPPWLRNDKYRPLKLIPARFADPLFRHFGVLARAR